MCDMAVLYDNTDSFQGFAIYQDGILVKINDNKIPKWYSRIIKKLLKAANENIALYADISISLIVQASGKPVYVLRLHNGVVAGAHGSGSRSGTDLGFDLQKEAGRLIFMIRPQLKTAVF